MSVKTFRKLASKRLLQATIAATLWSLSSQASALSLSELKLQSGLHQPFKASIALRNFDPIEMDRVSVEIANDAIQSHYNKTSYLPNELLAEIEHSARGTFIHLSSPTAVDEPFLKFAVQLNAPEGLIIRQYEVLLDPPKSLYTTAPSQPLKPQVAPATKTNVLEKFKQSIKLSSKDKASGIEVVDESPEQPQLAQATRQQHKPLIAAATPTALTAPKPAQHHASAQSELPQVAAMIDEIKPTADKPKATSALVQSQTLTDAEFLKALDEYSMEALATQRDEMQVTQAKAKQVKVSAETSTPLPQTAALMVEPTNSALPTAPKAQPEIDQNAIPQGQFVGQKSKRFDVQDSDFATSDADSVARALMRYRELARAGKKPSIHPSELVKMSAEGVKRISN